MSERQAQLILTLCVLLGFFLTVMLFMFIDMSTDKQDVMKLIMTSEGTACLLVLGFWFKPGSST